MINTNMTILNSIFDSLPSGIILLDLSNHLLRINQKAKEILGLPSELRAFELKQPFSLNAELPSYLHPLLTLLLSSEQDIMRAEIRLEIPSREDVSTIGYSLKQISSTETDAFRILTFTDITLVLKDRLSMDNIKDELNQSKKLASIGTMIAGVAHELNNPLTGISMSTSLIKMNLERLKKQYAGEDVLPLNDSIDKALQEIHKIARANEKASVLVSDLLAYSKPTQLNMTPLCLHYLVLDTANALKTHPQFSQFTFEFPEKSNRKVLCDRVKLEQVFYNLIKNACDATDGKGTVTITYSEMSDPQGKLQIAAHVRDNGPGIDTTVISRIFDPFFTTKGHSGVGLGLSISYRTVEQHGGLLSVQSVKLEGTEFKVTLPVYLEKACGETFAAD